VVVCGVVLVVCCVVLFLSCVCGCDLFLFLQAAVSLCAITGLPAKYKDPVSGTPLCICNPITQATTWPLAVESRIGLKGGFGLIPGKVLIHK